MLHFFFVHSFATYHCALGVIRKLGLDGSEVVFQFQRDFSPPSLPQGSRVVSLSERKKFVICSGRSALRSRLILKESDREVDGAMNGNPFQLYIPHSYYLGDQIIQSHPLCESYSYIEEGLTSYFSPGEIDSSYIPLERGWRSRVARSILYPRRLPTHSTFFHKSYRNVFGFSEHSFPGWVNKVIVDSPMDHGVEKIDLPGGSPVLVFDALVELGRTTAKALGSAVEFFLDRVAYGKFSQVYYKFHPGQRPETSLNVLRTVMKSAALQLELVELSAETSLETIAMTRDCEFFVFNSAAGLYAAIAGRKVSSLNRILSEIDPGYACHAALLPGQFRKLVPDYS